MDRFLMRLQMGYPSPESELSILSKSDYGYGDFEVENAVEPSEILAIQQAVPQVYLEPSVLEYILKLVTGTRTESEFKAGVSVRGSIALKTASQARALYFGRDFVMPDDVLAVALPVMAHRLNLRRPSSDALEERRLVEGILSRLLSAVEMPK